ncbi:MAG: methionine--tRNA ligase [Candidatus Anstonellales archaeon]
MEPKKILITAALPYANGPLHLGHIRSTYLPADICARYNRLKGNETLYICASDEHGTPIVFNAEKEGKSPKEFVDYYHEKDKQEFEALGFSMDIFHRTSSKENVEMTQHFFLRLKENGHVYKKSVEQYYCPKENRFLPDRYVKGTCPYCGADEQYSDQCESCGRTLKPGEIQNPKCAVCKTPPILKETEHYFFALSKFSEKLKGWIESNPEFQVEVKNFVLNWIEEGLRDWDITRNLNWGVPVPNEKNLVFYVWFDAPIGYLSSTVALTKKWQEFWKNKNAKIIHFIGKDITYHHYLFWPAMLMGTDENFNLPNAIPVRGYLNLEQKKFSKSRGWYITLGDYLKIFHPDFLRYYETAITPHAPTDASFSLEEFKDRVNNELVANFANLAFRILSLMNKKLDGKIEESKLDKHGELLIEKIIEESKEIDALYEKYEYKAALEKAMHLSSEVNRYISEREPWKETDQEKIRRTLYTSLISLFYVSILLEPIIPFTSRKFWKMLQVDEKSVRWSDIGKRKIEKLKLENVEHLLDKITDEQIGEMRKLLE